MTDVHAPHSPIHGVKDFFLHLVTITVGLLIALALDSAVEARHHRQQVAEARAAIEVEVAANQDELKKVAARLEGQQKTLDAMRAAVREPQTASPANLHLNVSLALLRRANYDTAQTSGALALMDYYEASKWAEVYQAQAIFLSLQDRAVLGAEISLVGALPGPENSLEGVEKLAPADVSALASKIDAYRGYLLEFIVAARELDDAYARRPR